MTACRSSVHPMVVHRQLGRSIPSKPTIRGGYRHCPYTVCLRGFARIRNAYLLGLVVLLSLPDRLLVFDPSSRRTWAKFHALLMICWVSVLMSHSHLR